MGKLLQDLSDKPSWEVLHALSCLPKLTLWAPRHKAQTQPHKLAQEVNRRLGLFNAGELSSLWESLETSSTDAGTRRSSRLAKKKEPTDTISPAVLGTIKGLIEEGAFSKATKHLTSEGVVSLSDPVVVEKLRNLHPIGLPVPLGDTFPTPPLGPSKITGDAEEWEQWCLNSIARFPAGSAPGPSGLRPAHLKDCIRKAGAARQLRTGLASFVHCAIDGKLDMAIQRVLCTSNLIPLKKKDGGIRPIAVGDTIRRLIGKVLLSHPDVKAEICTLQPRQCGVGVPYAAELIGMGTQRVAEVFSTDCDPSSPDFVVMQVDVRNAFNTLDRSAMLTQCLKKTPTIYNWLSWCYADPCALICQGHQVATSSCGVHQGDALGPIGFALGLEQALDECKTEEDVLPWSCWYLDDGTLVGNLDTIGCFVQKLVPALSKIGLQVNLSKCTLWGPGVHREEDMNDALPDTWDTSHPLRTVPIVPYGPSKGITVLGVPCDAKGSTTHADRVWQEVVLKTTDTLAKLKLIPESQLQHCLLRYCLDACKVNHLMRSTLLETGVQPMQDLSEALQTAACGFMGCGITVNAWEQATMPIRHGGLGIKDPVTIRPFARIAALANLHAAGTSVGCPQDLLTYLSDDTTATLTSVVSKLGQNHDIPDRWLQNPSLIQHADKQQMSQHWWTGQLAKVRRQVLKSQGTARDQIRLLSQEGPVASAWLNVTPSKVANTLIPDSDFRSLCRYWLGLPLLPDGSTAKCPLCGSMVDPFGDHFTNCKNNGPTRRHNALRDAWSNLLSTSAISHRREAVSGNGQRPADILLLNWDKGRDVAVDFTIVSPLTLDALPLSVEVTKRHLAHAEEAKYAKERNTLSCTDMRWGMQPAAFSPWGGAGPSAKHLLYETIKRCSSDCHGFSAENKSREFRETISVTIAREVAHQLSLRHQILDT